MLEDLEIIQRILSPYASPIIVLPRKCPQGLPVQETKTLSATYRKLNAQPPTALGGTSSGANILINIPKIYEMLACLHDSKFSTRFEMQILPYQTKSKTLDIRVVSAFTIIFRKYQFLRMPFGLVKVPAYFAALMQMVFSQFNDFYFFHMDHLLVLDGSENDRLKHLNLIFHKI